MYKLVVLSCVLAAAAAGVISPLGLAGPYGLSPYAYSSPLWAPYNYRGPLSLAPGQPASILAADGRPLDTLDVNLDRSAHYTAKALDGGIHLLKKRSAPLLGPLAVSHTARFDAPWVTPAHLAYAGPIGLHSAISPLAYRSPIAHIGLAGYHGAPYGHLW